ncbi:MAG: FAD binding domain-containing protein [Anaerolineae bacterium]|nr:FAD binding domain-containing protein [Anaerolineae bacterium]
MTTTDFFIPRSVDEALSLREQHGSDLTIMGGGTIIMGQVNDGALFPTLAMSLRLAGLDGIRRNGHLELGATTTIAAVSGLTDVPLLAAAAHEIGGPAVRNMATVGGNLFARAPYGDLCAPLLALDAEVEIGSAKARRKVALDQFLANRNLGADELLLGVQVADTAGQSAFIKYGRREANTPSVVAVAVRIATDAAGKCIDARIALGAAAPQAIRARQAEVALIGTTLDSDAINAAGDAAMGECSPSTDALATEWYRRKMVGVYVRRAIKQALGMSAE